MIFFTSDSHFNHGAIIQYCNRPFSGAEEMDKAMITNWNSVVTSKDTVYHLGDFSFKTDPGRYTSRLNGKKILIRGNHDKRDDYKKYFDEVYDLLNLTIEKQPVTLCHYAMRVWNRSHFNAYMLFGHCMDLETEILTNNGWKKRNCLLNTDKVMSLNLNNHTLEYVDIDEVVDYPNYRGKVYSLKSKGLDLRVTDKHVLIDVLQRRKEIIYRKFYANELVNLDTRLFIKAGKFINVGLDISDNFLKLIVWIAADGNLCNSDLVRIRVLKERKVNRIRSLLEELKISHRELKQKDNSISFNFTIPDELKRYRLKPISSEILNLSEIQVSILLEEYSHTDGYKNGKTFLIYTSKKEEADLIQIASIQNNYNCNIAERINHGFSKKISYELCITKRIYRHHNSLKERTEIENVENEHFWCVKNKNQTIVIRRNGKPIITGNSHGRLSTVGKSYDVGVDTNNFTPVSWEQIKEIMKDKPDNFNLIRK